MPSMTIELDEADDRLLTEIQAQLALATKEEALKAALRFRHAMLEKLTPGSRVILQGLGGSEEFGTVVRRIKKRKPLSGRKWEMEVIPGNRENSGGASIQIMPHEVIEAFGWDSAQGVAKKIISGKTLRKTPRVYLDDLYLSSFDPVKLK